MTGTNSTFALKAWNSGSAASGIVRYSRRYRGAKGEVMQNVHEDRSSLIAARRKTTFGSSSRPAFFTAAAARARIGSTP